MKEFEVTISQSCGGLIDDQHIRLQVHGPGDLHDLPVFEIQDCQRHIRLDFRSTNLCQNPVGLGLHRLDIQEAMFLEALQVAHEHVGCHIHGGQGARLLNYHGDLVHLGLHHVGGLVGLALAEHLAPVRLLRTGEDGGQGGLTAAVLTDEAADLAPADFEIHVDQRPGGAEFLADALAA